MRFFLLTAFVVVMALSSGAQFLLEPHGQHGHKCNHHSCGLQALDHTMNTQIGPPADFVPGGVRAAVISVNYTGFSAQAQTAFQYAVDIWSSLITSSVPITVNANWTNLGAGVLGSAGPTTFTRDFVGAPQANTFYPAPLANSMNNSDLNPLNVDIDCNFNSAFGNWYLGIDGNCPSDQYDFVSVVLHELCHGLGFVGSAFYISPNGYYGLGSPVYPVVYDRFSESSAGTDIPAFANPSVALGSALLSNDLYWLGSFGNIGNGGSRPRLYAPNVWAQGSSYSHLDESTYPAGNANSLMTYAIGMDEVIHNPGPVVLGMFQDMGWAMGAVSGCTDPTACNYDPAAAEDDGSCVYAPINDECYSAIEVIPDGRLYAGDNSFTCFDLTEMSCGNSPGTMPKDLWYSFEANGGQVEIETFAGSLSNTRIALFDICGGVEIGCNDDFAVGSQTAVISISCGQLTAGQTYYIMVAGYGDLEGTFDISVSQGNAPGCTDPNAVNYDAQAGCNNNLCLFLNDCGNLITSDGAGINFQGYYDPSNWTINTMAGSGSVDIQPSQLIVYGSNNNVADVITSAQYIAIRDGFYAFDWFWTTADEVLYDPALYINGTPVQLTNQFGTSPQSGTEQFFASAGTVIGFGINSTDGAYGAARLEITNFFWPGDCFYGCTDPSASNYDPLANVDNDSCILPGCTDANACNYDPSATLSNNSCIYPNACYLDCAGNCLNDTDGDLVCDEFEVFGCGDPSALNYNAYVSEEDGTCLYAGCTDPLALNYNPLANFENGSCAYTSGCTYNDADNYNPGAQLDDGSCIFPPVVNSCPADITGDGFINTNDLLDLLGFFGNSCP
jgi:hypothetical protein